MKWKNLLLMTFVAALLIAPAGCIFSPDDPGPNNGGGEEDLPPAITPEQMMANFEQIYSEMLIDEYEDMLHEDYQTILLATTLADWDWDPSYTFNKTDESTIHRKMFTGQPGKDSQGNPVHPIDSIDVGLMEPLGPWVAIPNDHLYFGGYDGGKWANYRVQIEFYNADQSHKYAVRQQVEFYAVPVEEDGKQIYKMLGQRGLELE